jgi:hypothetical protein
MRYIIDVKDKKTEKYLQDFILDNNVEKVDVYEPIERLSVEVEKLGRALREAKAAPGSWEVLNYYLRGRGVSQSTIDATMGPLTDFFKNIGIEIKKK